MKDDSCAISHRQLVKFLNEAIDVLDENGYDSYYFEQLLEWIVSNPTDELRSSPAKVFGL